MNTAEDINAMDMEQNSNANNEQEQYLTFIMGQEEYCIDILKVMEIRGWENATRLPAVPEYVKGIVNLRGLIVPIVDLRLRFKMETIDYTKTTVVIILQVKVDGKDKVMGLVVDGVSDVHNVKYEDIKPAPEISTGIGSEYIKGIVTLNKKILLILHTDLLLDFGELGDLDLEAKEEPEMDSK